jgi:peptidyl-prolyl cis-trans isomerase A (cyclophilin A)
MFKPLMRSRLVALGLGLFLLAATQIVRAQTVYVRFNTSLGNIDVQMLSANAPKNVANFLAYVDSGAYASSIIHRRARHRRDAVHPVKRDAVVRP